MPQSNKSYVSSELLWAGIVNGTLRARAAVVGPWEQYTFVSRDSCGGDATSACYAILGPNGRYVSAELHYSGLLEGLLRARASRVGPWEEFEIVNVGIPQWSCPGQFNAAADYQHAFDTRGPVWDGGDGGLPVDLGDGRHLWLFGDTLSGPADGTSLLPGWRLLHNSIAIEDSQCMQFRLGGKDLAHVSDVLPGPTADQWYWPTAGAVDRHAGVVYVSVARVTTGPGDPGFQWRVLGTSILTLDIHSLVVRSAAAVPSPLGLSWATSLLQSGPTIYVYGRGVTDAHQYVARTTFAHLRDGAWEFWNGTTWSTNPQVAAMQFETYDGAPDTGPLPSVTVSAYGNGFIASTKRCDILCDDLTAWYATAPNGPWFAVNENLGRVITTSLRYPGQIAYGGHLFPAAGGWLGLWSVGGSDSRMRKFMYGLLVRAPSALPSAVDLYARFSQPLPPAPASARRAPPPLVPVLAVPVPTHTDLPTTAGWVAR
jgi:hypothetical protein